ncbi:MAG: hypothetical protein ABI576_10250 [Flavobacterium sp.]
MSSFLGRKDLTRGIRNNNPGNLKNFGIAWQGKIPLPQNTDQNKTFDQFTDVKYGIRAMLIDLLGDIGKGKNTLRKLISEYAPNSENNTDVYISTVAKSMGVGADVVIKEVDFTFMFNLAKAIIKHECSPDHDKILDSDILDAIDIIDRTELNGVVINVQKKRKFNIIIIPVLLFLYTVFSVTV